MESRYSHLFQSAVIMALFSLNIDDPSAFALVRQDEAKNSAAMMLFSAFYLSTVAACFIFSLLLFHISLVRILITQPPPLLASFNAPSLSLAALAMLQLAVFLKGLILLLLISGSGT